MLCWRRSTVYGDHISQVRILGVDSPAPIRGVVFEDAIRDDKFVWVNGLRAAKLSDGATETGLVHARKCRRFPAGRAV